MDEDDRFEEKYNLLLDGIYNDIRNTIAKKFGMYKDEEVTELLENMITRHKKKYNIK